jgi:hypothetical protein
MSLLKKILPFLFKDKDEKKSKPATGSGKPASGGKQGSHSRGGQQRPTQPRGNGPKQGQGQPRPPREQQGDSSEYVEREPGPIVGYAIVAKNKNHRGLRKGSKVYIRQIIEDGETLRVRATSPSGRKVTLTLSRQALSDFQSEGVPEHLARHYSPDSIFEDEHEAMVKAEALGKR